MPETFHIVVNDHGLTERMRQFPARALAATARALDEQNELTVSAIISRRLSFNRDPPSTPDGLRVQSGRLRSSMRRTKAAIQGTGVVSSIGTNVKYAGVHEEGFTGTVQVPGHQRRLSETLSFRFGGKTTRRQVQGRDSFVRPHSRKMNLPARRFMARTIEERLPEYVEAIGKAVRAELDQP